MNWPDPVAEEAAYTLEQERRWNEWLDSLPTCEACGEPLSGEYYDLNGDLFCSSCVESYLHSGNDEDIAESIASVIYKNRRKAI